MIAMMKYYDEGWTPDVSYDVLRCLEVGEYESIGTDKGKGTFFF